MLEGKECNRRLTHNVKVGNTGIGGSNPVRIQSMTNTPTSDIEKSVAQAERLICGGAELVRLTAQGTKEAENIGKIRTALKDKGYDIPLVADIHFNPKAAYASIGNADKIRINPGNFVDPGRRFRKLSYTDEEYSAELEKLEASVKPFLESCAKAGTAIRIGVNHGSLSDRIMSRYGDTPSGMAESALEFLRICEKINFRDVVVSIKASNVVVMVETVKLLAERMSAEGMSYPFHLGVTEAGDGEDARVKSAVGIGTLLMDGIGDTIRVSLSEDPEKELPVARKIVDYVLWQTEGTPQSTLDRVERAMKRRSAESGIIGGENKPVVVGERSSEGQFSADITPEEISGLIHIKLPLTGVDAEQIRDGETLVFYTKEKNFKRAMEEGFRTLEKAGKNNPVIIKARYDGDKEEDILIKASIDVGSVLLEGYGDGIYLEADSARGDFLTSLSFRILQSVRLRMSSTEYIACPGCGRTMFDLHATLAEVKKATQGMKGLKIGVMGCIVNGPGEMADADYGYVGAGAGKISLYRGKECVEKNIPSEQAVEKLIKLIETDKKR